MGNCLCKVEYESCVPLLDQMVKLELWPPALQALRKLLVLLSSSLPYLAIVHVAFPGMQELSAVPVAVALAK